MGQCVTLILSFCPGQVEDRCGQIDFVSYLPRRQTHVFAWRPEIQCNRAKRSVYILNYSINKLIWTLTMLCTDTMDIALITHLREQQYYTYMIFTHCRHPGLLC